MEPIIEFENFTFKYRSQMEPTLRDINLKIYPGEKVLIIGPSGSGKSTLSNCINGLIPFSYEGDSTGTLRIEGKDPKKLGIFGLSKMVGTVLQDTDGQFIGLTVAEDIAFVLENDCMAQEEMFRKVDGVAETVEVKELLSHAPSEISGGQRQRVALGRAIVKDQKVFLMDEPLSNLDAKLRVSMRNEISKLHRNLGSTTIYVTHDQVEAMTMADRIVIMKDGVIQQVGKPMDLYEHPVNKFVAGFIGSPQMNFYDVKVDGKKLIFADGNTVELPEAIAKRIAGYSEVIMGIRGEDIKFDTTNLDVYGSHQKAVIDNTEIMGNENNLYFDFGGSVTIARVSKYEVSQVGDEVEFTFMPHKMHFFDKETEQVIGAE